MMDRHTAMMPSLPPGLAPYRRTPTFTARTVPQALQQVHSTKAGVWGRIVVLSGRLRYELIASGAAFELSTGDIGVIAPAALHRVEALGDATFYVEFLR